MNFISFSEYFWYLLSVYADIDGCLFMLIFDKNMLLPQNAAT